MSQTSSPFDPEVQALLEEIVADPSSTLLKVPEAPLSKWLIAREPPVSPREPVLTRAERYLVQAHREYIARLLLERSVMELTRGSISETRVHRCLTANERLPLPTDDAWRLKAEKELDSHTTIQDAAIGHDLLRRCVGGDRNPQPSQLVAASLRLAPCDQTRVWLGVALHREGQNRSALRVLHDILGHRPSTLDEAWARADCGLVHFWQGEFASAADWYRSAAAVRTDKLRPVFAFGWMTSALQLGDASDVRTASIRIDENVNSSDPVLAEFITALRTVSPSPDCKRILAEMHDQVSPVAKVITHVLLQASA